MSKRYYIASGIANVGQVRRVKARLDAAGWEHTYDWTVHGSVRKEGIKRLSDVAAAEVVGVTEAEVVIVLLPGGRGTHTELGVAISDADATSRFADQQDPRIAVYSPTPDKDFDLLSGDCCAFYFHPRVERWTDLDAMIDTLIREALS